MSFGRETQRYCPDDRTPLAKVSDPRGVTIDECPSCGVVVLDPGELQMLINTAASAPGFHPRPAGHFTPGHRPHRRHGGSDGFLGGFFGGSS